MAVQCGITLFGYCIIGCVAQRWYLRQNGYHFGKKACTEAVRKLKKHNPATGKMETIEPYTKDQVDELLTKYNIRLEHNKGYDYVYAANYGKARFY
ncbi:MAG: hypothetical protein NC548_31765, partial [Lachnospiraceae bacterium]|nr:hypothetical protein [Lachnospiraceae bacterium]